MAWNIIVTGWHGELSLSWGVQKEDFSLCIPFEWINENIGEYYKKISEQPIFCVCTSTRRKPIWWNVVLIIQAFCVTTLSIRQWQQSPLGCIFNDLINHVKKAWLFVQCEGLTRPDGRQIIDGNATGWISDCFFLKVLLIELGVRFTSVWSSQGTMSLPLVLRHPQPESQVTTFWKCIWYGQKKEIIRTEMPHQGNNGNTCCWSIWLLRKLLLHLSGNA